MDQVQKIADAAVALAQAQREERQAREALAAYEPLRKQLDDAHERTYAREQELQSLVKELIGEAQ